MTSDAIRHAQAIALYRAAELMFALGRRLVQAARRLDAWLSAFRNCHGANCREIDMAPPR